MSNDVSHLLEELNTIEENCLYTAQAHFVIAARKGAVVRVVFIGASLSAAIAGGLVAAGCPAWVGVFAAAGGLVSAVAAALGADKDVHNHRVAANVLTRARHEARALRETFSKHMDEDELRRETMKQSQAYSNLIQGLPPTDEKAIATAAKQIQGGRFIPDFRGGTGS